MKCSVCDEKIREGRPFVEQPAYVYVAVKNGRGGRHLTHVLKTVIFCENHCPGHLYREWLEIKEITGTAALGRKG